MKIPDIRGFFDEQTKTWTYVVYLKHSPLGQCAIIDSVLNYDIHSGQTKTDAADRVIEYIKSKKLNVQWILETHIHADHLTAASYIKEKLGGTIAISKHILTVLNTWEPIFHNEKDTPKDGSQFDHLFLDDEQFTIGDLDAKIIHTPGHTPADTSYIIGDAIFVGDALFLPDVGSGRCDFPGGDAKKSYESIQKILAFPKEYRIYVGHDYPPNLGRPPQCMTTIDEQRNNNIRIKDGISEDEFIKKRLLDDKNKRVPDLLLPSIQVNLRAGKFGQDLDGVYYIKIPVNQIGN